MVWVIFGCFELFWAGAFRLFQVVYFVLVRLFCFHLFKNSLFKDVLDCSRLCNFVVLLVGCVNFLMLCEIVFASFMLSSLFSFVSGRFRLCQSFRLFRLSRLLRLLQMFSVESLRFSKLVKVAFLIISVVLHRFDSFKFILELCVIV